MKIFCTRLKEVRNSFSQNEFAKRLGIPQSSYSRYESGKNEPDYELLVSICRIFNVSSDWLLGLTDERTPRGGASHDNATNNGSIDNNHGSVTIGKTEVCPRCAEKDATIATQAQTIQTMMKTISELIGNK